MTGPLGIILPQVYTAALAAIAEVATNYIFIYPLDLGVMLVYRISAGVGLFHETGHSQCRYVYFGGVGLRPLQASLQVPSSIQAATCVRVGNALGAGDTDRAIAISKMSLYLAGFWLGLVLCTVLQLPFFIFVIFKKLNWKTLTKEAVERAQTKAQMALLQENQTTNHGNSEDGQLSVGYRDPSVGYLSTPQLVLRRGLVLLVVVGLLAAGVIVHFLVPLPEMVLSWSNVTGDGINTTFAPDQIYSTVLVSVMEDH
ncbi:unnamed protein product [Tetraodon nigroviridis]|uniref:(spotted green pufferfish) hypothetical protein n=1 Tax=Tetraodon nigroviridis TaxID=99883 RepID=Q4RRP5_TETNG|nr:unnamed protein product [Tetraodon nigroviridis]